MRLLAPYFLQQVVKKAEENFRHQQQNYQQQQSQQSQSSTYSNTQNEMPKEKKKVGEYIDFEEIE